MALPSHWWLNQAGQHLRWFGPLAGGAISFILFITNIFTILIWGALDAIKTALEALDTTAFAGASFTIITGIGYVNAIFPLSEILIVLSAYYTAWIIVISVRWIKSFIPTVAN
jgi:hypothetical protein